MFNHSECSLTGPIPSGFPEPPPAYTEIDIASPQPNIVEQPRLQPVTPASPQSPEAPPRTQVILPGN